jgi:hypothetical protein
VGQQKHTQMQWYDASQQTFYFDSYDSNQRWPNNPEYMTDGDEETFAYTPPGGGIQQCNDTTYTGTTPEWGAIMKVELRVHGYYEGRTQEDIILRPVFRDGELNGENYTFAAIDQPTWSEWFDITNDGGHGSGSFPSIPWSWSNISSLYCDIMASQSSESTLYCSKIELRVTYNTAPTVSNPSPLHGSYGAALQPLLNITVADPDGDSMNVTWYSNSTLHQLTLHPNANGSSTQLSRHPSSTTANYLCVNEVVADDADYVYWSGTTWKNDTYALENHGTALGVIHEVTVYARCNRGLFASYPSVPNKGKIAIRSEDSYYYGSEFTPSSTFTEYSHSWLLNPATGEPWSWSTVDDLEAGVMFKGNEYGSSRCSQLYIVVSYTDPSLWLQFGSNISVGDGIYHQKFVNASVNGQWWYWKVNVDDGNHSTWSSVYKFYTGYQSKIENTGETDINGYLLMQIQYYNESLECWMVDNDTINETSPRTILSGSQLALDQDLFNGIVRVSDLTGGLGLYRVYVAFRDPNGDVLVCDDETVLEAWWEFTVI